MRYAIVTIGCRVNQADSLRVEEELRAYGGVAVSPDRAELVIVNTCSVTATAEQGARQTIRRIARDNPAVRIVATGCYATRSPTELSVLPGVLGVVPNDDKERLVGTLAPVIGLTTAQRFGDGDGACGAAIEPGVAGRTAFTLRVQTGCEEPCAYCIIPSTRGRGRSLPLAVVLAEIERAAAAGYKEVALTGVHLGSYGRDLEPSVMLVDLLRALDELSHRMVYRISSLEPMDCTPEIVDLVARSGRFAPHFHLPLQTASDSLLRSMRRPYTLDYYRRLLGLIRDRLPHASIGSDIIVGFPGESDEDVKLSLAYLAGSPLTHLHVFPYSDRPGTAASQLSPKVPGVLVRERAREVRAVGANLTQRFRESQVDSVRPGLTLDDGSLVVTDNYLKVRVRPGHARNEWVRVKITGAAETMTGEVVSSY